MLPSAKASNSNAKSITLLYNGSNSTAPCSRSKRLMRPMHDSDKGGVMRNTPRPLHDHKAFAIASPCA